MGGIYIERANKQTQEKSKRKGWGDGEMRTQASVCVGTSGPGRKSLLGGRRIPRLLEAGRGGGGGQATRAFGAGSPRPGGWERPGQAARGKAGRRVGDPRPRSPEQSRCALGLATHNKKLMSAVAWAAGSAVARPRGGGDVGGQARRRRRRRRG